MRSHRHSKLAVVAGSASLGSGRGVGGRGGGEEERRRHSEGSCLVA